MVYFVAVTVVGVSLCERCVVTPMGWTVDLCALQQMTHKYARAVRALCRRIDLE